jgi:GNAT superfamily N-acetyltransferase
VSTSSQESSFEIRLAQRRDLPVIVEMLERDSVSQPSTQFGTREQQIKTFEEISAHPDNELIVATLAGEVVATLQLTFIPGLGYGWRAQVEGVRVREDIRNQRIGSRLMEWVIQRARDRQCQLVQLTTNRARVDAQRFYGHLGFKPSHVGMKLYL